MEQKTIEINSIKYYFPKINDDMTINIGDTILRDDWEILLVTPKLFNSINNGHINNKNIKKILYKPTS